MAGIPAYIPRIGELLTGLDYDMGTSESVTHSNALTRHPIEDPKRSFITDHNREEPTQLRITIEVSSTPVMSGSRTMAGRTLQDASTVDRITKLQDKILEMRAAQAVATSAYFTVYTGLRAYMNMGIEEVVFTRDPETPNKLTIELSLVEFRFARPPRSIREEALMDANDGPRNVANAELVNEPDRMLVESNITRYMPRYSELSRQQEIIFRAALRASKSHVAVDLGIDLAGKAKLPDVIPPLNMLFLGDYPSQQYTLSIDGNDHEVRFSYNQMADRWSFSAWLSGSDCPRTAGRFVEPGVNLYAGLSKSEILVALDRPGITSAGIDWYARMTRPLGDGVPATTLVVGARTSFNNLFKPRSQAGC